MTKLEIYQGNTHTITVSVTDKDTGDASDLSGKTGLLVVKEKFTDTTTLFEVESTSVSGGDIVFDLTPDETQDDPGVYYAEVILLQDSPQYIKTILQFQLVIKDSLKY